MKRTGEHREGERPRWVLGPEWLFGCWSGALAQPQGQLSARADTMPQQDFGTVCSWHQRWHLPLPSAGLVAPT